MKLRVMYDDRKIVSNEISAFVSVNGYGSIIFRQKALRSRVHAICRDKAWGFSVISDNASLAEAKRTALQERTERVLWLPASLAPLGEAETADQMERMLLVDGSCVGTGLAESSGLAAFDAGATELLDQAARGDSITSADCYVDVSPAFVDVADLTNLVDYLSGALGARHFNSVKRSAGNIVKFSRNKAKIKAEHDYFQLLPAAMKRWLVMPFDYSETELGASYTMERLMLLDMGQQWINGGMRIEEFRRFLEDIFRFVDERQRRKIERTQARANFDALYRDKVKERLKEFQALDIYRFVNDMVRGATGQASLESVYDRYFSLLDRVVGTMPDYECVGHGDACFSNILYDRRTRLLKLIDPKGAVAEAQLYADPFYDVAKLSHSIMGGYDFISNGLYDITLGADLRLHLHTPEAMYPDYARLFVHELSSRGFDPRTVRLLEASLFLSMLPLHRDNPRNVLAYVLIAINILQEVESNVHA